jgi:hypothetical protein
MIDCKHIHTNDYNYKYITFENSDDEILMAIKYISVCETMDLILLIREDYFAIVSCINYHPHVETPNFIYYNSDGSGPDILSDNNDNSIMNGESTNPLLLFQNLVKYYNDFTQNLHH